ncbi:flavin-dependent oxidoreductase [Variovorax sp. M-6]|uniref:flavin-dependent oxidoreductase n=1 Tax=Variovorax sp. M-6 TaxID=3233041 RepID=UPI003F95EDB4
MKALIVGGGIGGLTAALALHAQGLQVQVVEAVPELKPLGVGINVLPHAVGVLSGLGLGHALASTAIQTKEVALFNRHGQAVWRDGRGLEAGYPFPQYSIHRGELQMLLYRAACDRLPEGALRLGQTLTGFTQTEDQVTAIFKDREGGTQSVGADILLGVDGIHSAVRRQLYPNEGKPKWSRMILYRGTSITPQFLSGRSMVQMGYKDLKFVCYPVKRDHYERGESFTNWIADVRVPDDEELRPEDWNGRAASEKFASLYSTWKFPWLDVPSIIATATDIFEFPMIDRDPLPKWNHGRVSLMGDAAHPMYPIGSNGATQAIMDAKSLSEAFVRHGASNWPMVFADYEKERLAATTALVMANRQEGGLDGLLDLVDERAPHGFQKIEDVVSEEEIKRIVFGYKAIAGHQNVPGVSR